MSRIHGTIKKALGVAAKTDSAKLLRDWKRRTSRLCKPCWELHYCPYGPIVEDFPLLPPLRARAKQHNEYLRAALQSGYLADGQPLDANRKRFFRKMVADYKPNAYPETIPKVLTEASCKVYGHLCPVFFVAEPLTETKDRRSHSRVISREVMLKVVRRDGQICQRCHDPVPDDEVEFDHIIPFSKGGLSTAENLRLVHRNCNRRKSDSLGEVLHPQPIQHLFELRSRRSNRKSKTPR